MNTREYDPEDKTDPKHPGHKHEGGYMKDLPRNERRKIERMIKPKNKRKRY